MRAKHIPGESYDEWTKRSEDLNKAAQTDPPTQRIGIEDFDQFVDYPNGTAVQWVCPCGSLVFRVYYEEGGYRTFVRCVVCGKQYDVHTG